MQHQRGQRLLQVELQQLDGLQAVALLLVSRPPAALLEQSEIGAAVHPGEQLGTATTTLSIMLAKKNNYITVKVLFFQEKKAFRTCMD